MKYILAFLIIGIFLAATPAFPQTVTNDENIIKKESTNSGLSPEASHLSLPAQIIMTQNSIQTQFIEQTIISTVTDRLAYPLKTSKYSWLVPGLPQCQTGQKLKGGILGIFFLSTAIGSLSTYISANNVYSKSKTKWDEALQTVNYSNRMLIIKESYDNYEKSVALLTVSRCLAGVAAGIWIYSIYDHANTIWFLKKTGLQITYNGIFLQIRI